VVLALCSESNLASFADEKRAMRRGRIMHAAMS